MTERAIAPNEIETVGGLYDRYGPSMYRYALILLTDRAAAEDAVHDVFTSVLRSSASARVEADERYLRRAIRNECFSMLRQRVKRRWIQMEPAGLLERIASTESKPDERLALEGGIRRLTPEQREIVHLHVFEGLTFKEISEASCTSPNTVAARYRYALARLRLALESGRADDARQNRR